MSLTQEQKDALKRVAFMSPQIRVAVAMVKLYPVNLIEVIKTRHGKT